MKYIFPDNSGFVIPPTTEYQNMPFYTADDNVINDIDDTARKNDYVEYLYIWRQGYKDTPIEHDKIYIKNKKDDIYYYYDIRVDWFYHAQDLSDDDFLDTTRYIGLSVNGRSKIVNNPKEDVSEMIKSAIKNSLDKFKDFLNVKFIVLAYKTKEIFIMTIRNYTVTTVYMSPEYNNNLYDYLPTDKKSFLDLDTVDIKKIDKSIKRYNRNMDKLAGKFGVETTIIDLLSSLSNNQIKIIRKLSKLQLEKIKNISDIDLHSIRFLKNDDIKIIRDVTWKLKEIMKNIM